MNFNDADIDALAALTSSEIDELSFGVVAMTHDGIVSAYNATEAKQAGMSPERVIGRHFFSDVAPCTNNFMVADRYEKASLDETLDYLFTLRMKPTRVKLRLLKAPHVPQQYMLVMRQ